MQKWIKLHSLCALWEIAHSSQAATSSLVIPEKIKTI